MFKPPTLPKGNHLEMHNDLFAVYTAYPPRIEQAKNPQPVFPESWEGRPVRSRTTAGAANGDLGLEYQVQ